MHVCSSIYGVLLFAVMMSRVCICCGETMRESLAKGHPDPNVCLSCSSLLEFNDWFKEARENALGLKVEAPAPEPTAS